MGKNTESAGKGWRDKGHSRDYVQSEYWEYVEEKRRKEREEGVSRPDKR